MVGFLRRKPKVSTPGVIERVGMDVTEGVKARDTVWVVKLRDSDEILRFRDDRAPEGHMSLTQPGDHVVVVRRGRKVVTFLNSELAQAMPPRHPLDDLGYE